MRRWIGGSAVVLLAAAACARPPVRQPAPSLPVATDSDPGPLGAEAAAVRDVVTTFIVAEASGDPADSLLAPEADFIMTGIGVSTPPRLAGLNGPGSAAVESANTFVAGGLAYVVVVYRFDARDPALDERSRATFVLEKQRAGWRIRHVHTSMVASWDR